MEHTLAHAAKVAGLNKSTLFRAIKAGRLSARRLDDGSYRIDGSELARVYDLQRATRNDSVESNKGQRRATPSEAAATSPLMATLETELAVLQIKVTMLEDQLAREQEFRDRERETILETTRETVEDLRRRLDKSEERVLALVPPTIRAGEDKLTAAPLKAMSRSAKGFFARILGR